MTGYWRAVAIAALALMTPTLAHAQQAPAAARPAAMSASDVLADPLFQEPYVDIDEWRDTPVRHRYVHGGFTGTDMRFSYYMPPKEKFDGRFFQYVTPVPDNENLSQTVQKGDEQCKRATKGNGRCKRAMPPPGTAS